MGGRRSRFLGCRPRRYLAAVFFRGEGERMGFAALFFMVINVWLVLTPKHSHSIIRPQFGGPRTHWGAEKIFSLCAKILLMVFLSMPFNSYRFPMAPLLRSTNTAIFPGDASGGDDWAVVSWKGLRRSCTWRSTTPVRTHECRHGSVVMTTGGEKAWLKAGFHRWWMRPLGPSVLLEMIRGSSLTS